MKIEINTKIKVFPQLYVGRKKQFEYSHLTKVRTQKVDLGFAMPFEKNAAFEKRKITVDNWAMPNHDWDPVNRKPIPVEGLVALIFDNIARTGFKITDDVRRVYWGGGNVVWRVEDPLGFELEISSQNLMAIIQTVGLNPGGLIPGKCVWARDGSNNVLLHEDTQEFKTAYKVGQTSSAKGTKLSPELIGARVSFSSGYVGTYLGSGSSFTWNATDATIAFREEFFHFFLDELKINNVEKITLYRDPKPLLIEDGVEMTDAFALKMLNANRDEFRFAGNVSYSSYNQHFSEVSRAKKAKSFEVTFTPQSTEAALKKLKLEAHTNWCSISPTKGDLLLGVKNGAYYPLNVSTHSTAWMYGHSKTQPHLLEFTEVALLRRSFIETGHKLTVKATNPQIEGYNEVGVQERCQILTEVLANFDSIVQVLPAPSY